jgi:hypothetical protein
MTQETLDSTATRRNSFRSGPRRRHACWYLGPNQSFQGAETHALRGFRPLNSNR